MKFTDIQKRQYTNWPVFKQYPLAWCRYKAPEGYWTEGYKEIKYSKTCQLCNSPITPYDTKYYGKFSNMNSYQDQEFSHETGYCKECAVNEAIKTRNKKMYADYLYIKERIPGALDDTLIFSDGVVCETTEESMKEASKMHQQIVR